MSRPGWSTSVEFSPDGKRVFYLMRRQSKESPSELWRTDLESGKTERMLPEFSMIGYDIAPPGQQIVFSKEASEKGAELWVAWLDGSSRLPAWSMGVQVRQESIALDAAWLIGFALSRLGPMV